MDSLPDSLLLQILTHLSDSADVARCRVASKAFNTVFPSLRSINLQYSINHHACSNPRVTSSSIKPLLLDIISKLKTVESVSIGHEDSMPTRLYCVDPESRDDLYLADDEFVNRWLPRVSESLKSLKSLSVYGLKCHMDRLSNILPLVSKHCQNLVELKLKYAWLSVESLNPMPMLTSLTLKSTRLEDEHLHMMNTCFPNLLVFNLIGPTRLEHPWIQLLNLKACHLDVYDLLPLASLTLIAPNLITLKIQCSRVAAVHIEAPVLSDFDLVIDDFRHGDTFTVKKFENLKTLSLDAPDLGYLLLKFPITKTVEKLTLFQSGKEEPIDAAGDSNLSRAKVFKVFPNVTSLRANSSARSELDESTV